MGAYWCSRFDWRWSSVRRSKDELVTATMSWHEDQIARFWRPVARLSHGPVAPAMTSAQP